jgi:O-antigen/teichoic acid export membrane protein
MIDLLLRIKGYIAHLSTRRVIRDSGWMAAGQVITIVAGIISIRIFTELASHEVFGGANLLIGALTLANSVATFPISQTQARYHTAYALRSEAAPYTRLMARRTFWAALFVILGCVLVMTIFPAVRMGGTGWTILLAILLVGAMAAKSAVIAPVQAERRMKRYGTWLASEAMLTLLATSVALMVSPTVEGFVAGQLFGIGIASVIFGRLPPPGEDLPARRTQRLTLLSRRQIIRYGLPFVPIAAIGFVGTMGDRYVLGATLDAAAVGKYAAAFAIAFRLPGIASGILTDVFRPILFTAESAGDKARADLIFLYWLGALISILAAIGVAMALFGQVLADIFLAPDYREGAGLIMTIIAIGYGFNTIAQAFDNRLYSLDASHLVSGAKFLGAASSVALALWLTPGWGAVGAALANGFGNVILMLSTAAAMVWRRSTSRANAANS